MRTSCRLSITAGRAVIFLLLLYGLSRTASAQTTYGLIEGRITDATGGALPEAAITVTQATTGLAREVVTNELGLYRVLNLDPAEDDVTVERSGFAKVTSRSFKVDVGQAVVLNDSVEHGRAGGAVVSAVTKSGTNAFQGPATPSFETTASRLAELPSRVVGKSTPLHTAGQREIR